jgi:hypothetical protein
VTGNVWKGRHHQEAEDGRNVVGRSQQLRMLVEHYENLRYRRIHDRADVAVASPLVKHLYTFEECMEQGFSEVRTTKQRSSHPRDSPYRGCAWDPALARVSIPGGSATPQGLLRLAPCLVHRPIAYGAAPGGVGLYYIVEMKDSTHQRLPAAALTRILTDADGEPL